MDFLKDLIKILTRFITFFGATGIWLIKIWGSNRLSFRKFVLQRQLTHPIWFQVIVGLIFLWLIVWVLRFIF